VDATGPILVVDDEPDLRQLVELNLRREGFRVISASTGKEGLDVLEAEKPSLVLLDLMLPDMTGTEVCRRIRMSAAHQATPVIMLTARGEEIDRVVGFEVGADDYVVKADLSMRELVLRVRAVLRRQPVPGADAPDEIDPAGPLVFDRLHIDTLGHRAFVDEEEIALTATEFRLLVTLASRPCRVQTRGTLLRDVWDMPPDLNTRTVDTHVKRLREKLGPSAGHVETVRGVGYRFNIDASGPLT
jgi:two-component system phosphate regulon response regulator PhoB